MITRRGLLGSLLLAPLTRFFVSPEEHHYFDWSANGPLSTDPRYAGKLTHGLHNVVYLNGVEVNEPMQYFVTGPKGWIERLAKNSRGFLRIENNDLVRTKVFGHVTFRDTRDV
jgi:hypothetical protein